MNKRNKKIAILIDQFVLGGVQKAAFFEAFLLNKIGTKAKILILMRSGFQTKFTDYFPKTKFKFLSDHYPKIFKKSIKFPIFSFFSTLHLLGPFLAPQVVKPKDFNIIIAHGTTTCLTALALWKKHRIPYIAVIHDPMEYILKKVYFNTPLRYFFWLISPILFYLEKQIIKNAKTVIVDSEKHSSFIQKNYGINPEVLTLGAQPLLRLPKVRKNYLVASSRWELGKNPQLLLEIMKFLPNNKLLIVGNWTNPSDLSEFKQKIKESSLEKRVIIKKDVPPKQLTRIYSEALVWIHPNVEAFGLGGFEAASCGCPVIMPKGSGLNQILKNGVDGFFPDQVTIEDFLKPVKYLISHPDIAKTMGLHAWNTIKNGLSWQNHVKQLEGLISFSLNKVEVVALETGHAQGTVISGGDKLLEEMSVYFSHNIDLTVIIPKIAAWHWRRRQAHIITLKETIFDNNPSPFPVFTTYIIRILSTIKLLIKLQPKQILYSSTNVFPDVIPAYLFKLMNPKVRWFARIHHLTPPPHKRPGNFLINTASYLLQEISLVALKYKADLVAALNPMLRVDLLKIGFRKEKLVVVTAGIKSRNFKKSSKLVSKPYDGVFLGRMHPSKGILDLIPIWSSVCKILPEAKLVIIGQSNPAITQSLYKQASEYNFLKKNVQILGPLSDNKVQEYLTRSKLFYFTDHEAGFGLAGLEAMSLGLPVIGWDIGILGNVFKKGFIKIKPFDYNQFALKTVELLQNNSKLGYLSKQAIIESKEHDWKKVAVGFESLLYKLASNSVHK
ncbi:glycosyltransferase [Candidatus Daviesbacteria bacterium]|nr:glycosyltransferase [Candidatus Daviesbacteria bacterium]